MVLLEVDTARVSGIELECNAPRPVDMNGVANRGEASQRVEVEPGQVHLFRRIHDIQPVETDQNALMQFGIDPGAAAFRPQIGQRLAAKRQDHASMRKPLAYSCQRVAYIRRARAGSDTLALPLDRLCAPAAGPICRQA
jgi:hypothetical protein